MLFINFGIESGAIPGLGVGIATDSSPHKMSWVADSVTVAPDNVGYYVKSDQPEHELQPRLSLGSGSDCRRCLSNTGPANSGNHAGPDLSKLFQSTSCSDADGIAAAFHEDPMITIYILMFGGNNSVKSLALCQKFCSFDLQRLKFRSQNYLAHLSWLSGAVMRAPWQRA